MSVHRHSVAAIASGCATTMSCLRSRSIRMSARHAPAASVEKTVASVSTVAPPVLERTAVARSVSGVRAKLPLSAMTMALAARCAANAMRKPKSRYLQDRDGGREAAARDEGGNDRERERERD